MVTVKATCVKYFTKNVILMTRLLYFNSIAIHTRNLSTFFYLRFVKSNTMVGLVQNKIVNAHALKPATLHMN